MSDTEQARGLGTLHIRFPDGGHESIEITESPFNIGRGTENHLQLPDPKVSRSHARVLFEGDAIRLIDLNSSNGTFFGDDQLTPNQPYDLEFGQQVSIGPYRLHITAPEPEESEEQPEAEAAEAGPSEDEPAAEAAGAEPVSVEAAEDLAPEEPEAGPEIGEAEEDSEVEPEPEEPAEEAPKLGGVPVPPSPPTEPPEGPETPTPPEFQELDPLFGIPGDRSRYLDFLPPIYEEQPFLGQFLLAFEGVLAPIEQTVDNFDLYLDAKTTPSDFLYRLAYWLGLSLDEKWPEEKRRAVVAEAAELFRRRGTRWSLTRHLEIYTELTAEIEESKEQPHHFTVSLRVPKAWEGDRETVERIIQANKPAHTTYDLEIKR